MNRYNDDIDQPVRVFVLAGTSIYQFKPEFWEQAQMLNRSALMSTTEIEDTSFKTVFLINLVVYNPIKPIGKKKRSTNSRSACYTWKNRV
ncbi:hypothetical protein BDR04DRAFT_101114 [Suillus decipiens]|nr:hypothetical protein BDR04DRAFT_101114 [Suillus decipiens]